MRIWPGTMIPARISPKITLRPRKRVRENPKAARLARSTVIAVIASDVRALLKYQRGRLPALSTARKASIVTVEAIHSTGTSVVSASGFSAVATAQASGTNQRMAKKMSTPKAIRSPRRLFPAWGSAVLAAGSARRTSNPAAGAPA